MDYDHGNGWLPAKSDHHTDGGCDCGSRRRFDDSGEEFCIPSAHFGVITGSQDVDDRCKKWENSWGSREGAFIFEIWKWTVNERSGEAVAAAAEPESDCEFGRKLDRGKPASQGIFSFSKQYNEALVLISVHITVGAWFGLGTGIERDACERGGNEQGHQGVPYGRQFGTILVSFDRYCTLVQREWETYKETWMMNSGRYRSESGTSGCTGRCPWRHDCCNAAKGRYRENHRTVISTLFTPC